MPDIVFVSLDIPISALSFSYLGVPFFFILSSFLITYRLMDEYKFFGKIHLPKFYLKRGLRIWPIYFSLLFICFFLIPLVAKFINIKTPTLPDILPFIFFYSNFYMIWHGMHFISALTVLWSLGIEEQFYIFWGAMLKYLRRYLVFVIMILLLGSILFSCYYLYQFKGELENLRIHSLYVLPNFCFGALIAFVCQTKNRVFNFLMKIPNIFYLFVYISFAVFFTLQNFYFTHFNIIVASVFNSTCYALILFDQTFNGKIFNAGKFKSINYLGKISYGLYIYHLLIASFATKALYLLMPSQNIYVTIVIALVTLLFTILTAHISYQYFEKYFLRLKDNLKPV